jgi:hypothetical protein
MSKYFLTVLFGVLIFSCDAFYTIPLNEKSDTLKVNFDCGNVEIYLQNWQGHVFDFYQTFNVNKQVTLNLDSLRVKYKNNLYPCHFIEYSDSVKLTILGNKKIRTAFRIKSKVNKGDTIFVYPQGYIYCGDHPVRLDSLILIMKEDLRGPMGS